MNRAGQVVPKLKTAWRDGTSHHVMAPMEFMQRLAALVPKLRLHLIRFHGVLAPNAKLRKAVVLLPPPPPPVSHRTGTRGRLRPHAGRARAGAHAVGAIVEAGV